MQAQSAPTRRFPPTSSERRDSRETPPANFKATRVFDAQRFPLTLPMVRSATGSRAAHDATRRPRLIRIVRHKKGECSFSCIDVRWSPSR